MSTNYPTFIPCTFSAKSCPSLCGPQPNPSGQARPSLRGSFLSWIQCRSRLVSISALPLPSLPLPLPLPRSKSTPSLSSASQELESPANNMEGDLGWCCSSEGNNWDLHAVVRSACSGGGRGGLAPPSASNDSSWLLQMPATDPLLDAAASQPPLSAVHDQAVDDLCLQAFFASPKLLETPQPSSLRNAAPPQRSKADGPTGKPRTSGRAGGAERSRSKRKYVLYLCIYLSGISVLDK